MCSLRNDQSRNHKIGVAVLPVGSRIKIKRLARPLVENFVGGDGLQHERRNIVLGPVVLVARCMRQQFTNRNLVAAGQVGNESRHGIVERKLPLFREQQHRSRRKLLADGTDAVAHRRQRGRVRLDAAFAIGLEIGDRSSLHGGDRGARNAGVDQRLLCDRINVLPQRGGDWRRGLRLRKRSGEQNNEQNKKTSSAQISWSQWAIHSISPGEPEQYTAWGWHSRGEGAHTSCLGHRQLPSCARLGRARAPVPTRAGYNNRHGARRI